MIVKTDEKFAALVITILYTPGECPQSPHLVPHRGHPRPVRAPHHQAGRRPQHHQERGHQVSAAHWLLYSTSKQVLIIPHILLQNSAHKTQDLAEHGAGGVSPAAADVRVRQVPAPRHLRRTARGPGDLHSFQLYIPSVVTSSNYISSRNNKMRLLIVINFIIIESI